MSGDHNQYQKPRSYLDDFECPRCGHCCKSDLARVGEVGVWGECEPQQEVAERNKLADWMIERGYATGHGDSTEGLLKELEWQIEERIKNEREACAKVCDVLAVHPEYASDITKVAAQAIRARGEK